MGDGILGHLSKGPIHRKVDDYVNAKSGGTYVNRSGFLNKLINQVNTSADYLQILQNDVGIIPSDINYLASTWYDTGAGGWWHNLQPIFPILNRGLIKALQVAGTTLPLDSYWIPMPGAPQVSVVIAKSPAQVTRIILTPKAGSMAQQRTQAADMWEVTQQTNPASHVGDTTIDAIVEAVPGNEIIWQRREFPPRPSPASYGS